MSAFSVVPSDVRRLGVLFAVLAPLCQSVFSADESRSPDAVEQNRMIAAMRAYAAKFRIPDVTYRQTTVISQRESECDKWRELWRNDAQRIAYDGHEYVCCRLGKNRKPIANQWVEAWYTPGAGSFPWDRTNGQVAWTRWDSVRGHRVAVFEYHVDREESHLIVADFNDKTRIPRSQGYAFSGPVSDLRGAAVVPYSGTIWIDPTNGAIWRQSTVVAEYPPRVPTRLSSVVKDFESIKVGATEYLLKVTEVSIAHTRLGLDRLERTFRDYRMFQADSSITFFGVESTINYPR